MQDDNFLSGLSATSTGENRPASLIVIGLGNPILGDDGIGWAVAHEVQELLAHQPEMPAVDVECLSLGGLSLMEHLIGYEKAILIDAMNLGQGADGSLHRFSVDDLPDEASSRLRSAHDTSLQTAIKVGRSMGANLPREILVIGVETQKVFDFSETLSEPVKAALPAAVKLVMHQIVQGDWRQSPKE